MSVIGWPGRPPVQLGGLARRHEAEHQAGDQRATEGADDGRQGKGHRDLAEQQHAADAQGQGDPGQAADHREHRRLGEELAEDIALAGASGHADADLAGAFAHGHEHDVHHADPAYQQGDRGDRAEHQRQGVLGLRLGLDHRRVVGQLVVALAAVQAQHQLVDGAFGLVHALGVGGGDDHVLGVARAEQADAGSGVGDGDAVVGILVAGAGAFLGEYADDLERHVLDEDVAADRVGAAEQLLAHLVADHRDRGGGVFVALGEVAALGHRPVEDFREVGVVAADVGVVVDVAVAHH
ncbi:Uncharacterised protein [Pseudomonas aeruginosa]|nr:Uncharacterised protein [Pseudomonas aeruginosa]